jgi:hypothetical protein
LLHVRLIHLAMQHPFQALSAETQPRNAPQNIEWRRLEITTRAGQYPLHNPFKLTVTSGGKVDFECRATGKHQAQLNADQISKLITIVSEVDWQQWSTAQATQGSAAPISALEDCAQITDQS